MNIKAKPTLTISEILNTIKSNSLTESREILYKQIGAMVEVSGEVLKKITRHAKLKLLIRPVEVSANNSFQIFAEFGDKDAERVHTEKIKKRSKVKISGQFQTSGSSAVNLYHCQLRGEK